jgi:chromosomal replication initiator protein
MMTLDSTLWTRISKRIRERVSADGFERWFSGIQIASFADNVLTLSVPNPIHQFFIESNYLPIVKEAVLEEMPGMTSIQLQSTGEAEMPARPAPAAAKSAKEKPAGAQLQGLNPRNRFDSFVVGTNNEFAHSAALAVANSPAITYNPLFVYGVSGLGKTHLLHAIGHHVLAKGKASKIVYLSSEQFTNEFIDAIQHGTLVKFRKKYRQADVLLIDDIQFFAGKERSQ